jgi:hypothetical protein
MSEVAVDAETSAKPVAPRSGFRCGIVEPDASIGAAALNLKIYPCRRDLLHYRYVNLAFQASA